MSFYSPNFAIGSGWRSSMQLVVSQLRKIKFVVEETFSWGDFEPQATFSGMTVAGYAVKRARYLKLWGFLFFRVDLIATLSGAMSNAIYITVPGTAFGDTGELQSAGCRIDNVTLAQSGTWNASGQQDVVGFYLPNLANYVAGDVRISAVGLIEVS